MRRQAQHQKRYSWQLQGFKSSSVQVIYQLRYNKNFIHHHATIATHKAIVVMAKIFMIVDSISESESELELELELELCMPFSARERLSKWFDNREVVRWFDSRGMARWLDHRGVVR